MASDGQADDTGTVASTTRTLSSSDNYWAFSREVVRHFTQIRQATLRSTVREGNLCLTLGQISTNTRLLMPNVEALRGENGVVRV